MKTERLIFFSLFLSAYLMAGSQTLKVITTNSILADITKNIAGDSAEVTSLLPVGADPHIYEAVPSDAVKLASADLVIVNGLKLEGWLDKLISEAAVNVTIREASRNISPIENPVHREFPDPHAWMSTANGITYAQNIAEYLSAANPAAADYYHHRFSSYRLELQETDRRIRELIEAIPQSQRVLITSHDAFAYFAGDYGLQVMSLLGTSTDADIQTGDVARIIQRIKEDQIPVIFPESTVNPKVLNQISKDTRVKLGKRLFADSLGEPGSEAGTYRTMLLSNAEKIASGLQNTQGDGKKEEDLLLLMGIIALVLAASFFYVVWKVSPVSSKSGAQVQTISIRNLSVSYEKRSVLRNVNISLESGSLYGLIGPNGAGKSTLIKSIIALKNPDEGEISFDGMPVNEVRERIAYIPQKEEIDWTFPATVRDVVMMGRYPYLQVFSSMGKTDERKAMLAMEKMEIAHLKHKQIGELSGGQQQRVFIARAICQEAQIMFMDEPFVGVDVKTEQKIIQMLHQMRDEGKLILVIHHDLNKVENYFDRLILVNQRVIAAGKTSEVFTQENIRLTYDARLTLLQETETFRI